MIQKFLFVSVALLGSLVTRQALINNPIFTAYPINDILGNALVVSVLGISLIMILSD